MIDSTAADSGVDMTSSGTFFFNFGSNFSYIFTCGSCNFFFNNSFSNFWFSCLDLGNLFSNLFSSSFSFFRFFVSFFFLFCHVFWIISAFKRFVNSVGQILVGDRAIWNCFTTSRTKFGPHVYEALSVFTPVTSRLSLSSESHSVNAISEIINSFSKLFWD